MASEKINTETKCRVCGGRLKDVLDFGSIFPSGFIGKDDVVSEEDKAPLALVQCSKCALVQLKHTIDLDLMYRKYWYSSSLNKSMISSLKDVVCDIEARLSLTGEDVIVDIGCNDGTMLNLFSVPTFKVGFDPALNLSKPKGVTFINDYFSAKEYSKIFGHVKAKVITAIAMFYDLPSPVKFVFDVKEILHGDGIFIIQFTDLLSMFKATAFDNVCHEHLEYYTLSDVAELLSLCDIDVIDVSYNDVNGGSVRITSAHRGRYPISDSVDKYIKDEKEFLAAYSFEDFKKKVDTTKMKIRGFLKWVKDKGCRTHLFGASTKGNTLLQLCGIDNTLVDFAAEVNSDKFGLRTVGSNIEIISEDESLIKHPEYYLVPVWHFKNSILKNSKIIDYLNSGGSLIFPLPEFTVITMGHNNTIIETRV